MMLRAFGVQPLLLLIAIVAIGTVPSVAMAQGATALPQSQPQAAPASAKSAQPGATEPQSGANASEAASNSTVLVRNEFTAVTVGDYRAELLRMPPDVRGTFGTDPHRVRQLIQNLLANKTLAAKARQAGLEHDEMVKRQIALNADRILAQLQLEALETKAGTQFDQHLKDFEAKARENYLVDRTKYRIPETVSASHILLTPKLHGGEENTRKLALELRAKILAGADFATVARENSDDPGAKATGGRLGFFTAESMDPAFAKAAFAMHEPGEVSEPVLSQFGYHLIKFEGRRPARVRSFEEVKPEIMRDMRERYVNEQRDAELAKIEGDPKMLVNVPAIDTLVVRVDPSLLAPQPSAPKRP